VTSAAGIGLATIAADGTVIDTWFPAPELGPRGPSGTSRLSAAKVSANLAGLAGRDEDRGTESMLVRAVTAALDY
jgi:2,3,4,5-tetrahydropyridine-2-carboxylate N-succinyltransferase